MYHKIRLVLLVVLLATVLLALGSGAQAKAISNEKVDVSPFPESLVIQEVISAEEQEAALSFWTREAIAAAHPLPMPILLMPDEMNQATAVEPEITGEPGFVAPAPAAPDAGAIARAAFPDDWAALEKMALPQQDSSEVFGTNGIHTAYILNKWAPAATILPHKWVGKLTYTVNGVPASCSGSAISGNVMLTAAHCVYDTTNNVWHGNKVFAPAYQNGNTPFGTFATTTCHILVAYDNLVGAPNVAWVPLDVAVCEMGNNQAGQTLNQAVGSMGRQWNQAGINHYYDMGYPGKDVNNANLVDAGKYLRTCVAESAEPIPGLELLRMGCVYGAGMSGGPWITNYAIDVLSGYAGAVHSIIVVGQPNGYGPRFTNNNIVPLCNAAGC